MIKLIGIAIVHFQSQSRKSLGLKIFIFFLGIFSTATVHASPEALRFSEFLRGVLATNNSLSAHSELIEKSNISEQTAYAPFWPSLSWNNSWQWQESGSSVLAANISPSNQFLSRFTLSYNLFRGFRDHAQLSARTHEHASLLAQRAGKFWDVSVSSLDAFRQVSQVDSDLEELTQEILSLKLRYDEIQRRVKEGQARLSDALALESSLLSAQAQRDASVLERRLLERQLSASLGVEVPNDSPIISLISESVPEIVEAKELDSNKRPEIVAKLEELQAVDSRLTAASSGHWPTVDLVSNAYVDRPGVLESVSWDIALQVQLPIFNGFMVYNQRREALQDLKIAELVTEDLSTHWKVEREQLVEQLAHVPEQINAMSSSVKILSRRVDQLDRDRRSGLATLSDVLMATTTLSQQKRTLGRLRVQKAYLQWKAYLWKKAQGEFRVEQ